MNVPLDNAGTAPRFVSMTLAIVPEESAAEHLRNARFIAACLVAAIDSADYRVAQLCLDGITRRLALIQNEASPT